MLEGRDVIGKKQGRQDADKQTKDKQGAMQTT